MNEDRNEPEVISPTSLELIQRSEIDMQIATARKYPRDLARVKRKMITFATMDEETAESCFYSVPRDGKTIQGPSVRLAEIAVACYQNLRAASRIIDNNGKVITSQGACHDLENNTLISVEVQRRITNRRGETYSDDMQVTAGNAANAISFRNAVFKVIPGALIKPVYEAAKAVAIGSSTTLAVKRDKMIKRLNSMHVDTPRILAKLGKSSVENIDLEDLEALIGFGTAIKDGDISIDEAFPPVKAYTDAAQADRQKQQMDEQARKARAEEHGESQPKADTPDKPQGDQDASHESLAKDPESARDPKPSTGPVSHSDSQWADRKEMLDAFRVFELELGTDEFWRVMGVNGIPSGDDLTLNAPDAVAAYRAIKEHSEFLKPEQFATPRKPPITFGKKPTR